MVDPGSITAVYGIGYLATLLGLVALVRDIDPRLRDPAYLLAGIPFLALISSLLDVIGLSSFVVNGNPIYIPLIVVDIYAYVVLYGGVAMLAGAPRRLAGGVIAVALLQRFGFVLGRAATPGSAVATIAGLGVFLGYPILVYLFLRPIWRHAQSVDPHRRLVHWKARNVMLFVFGMILVYAVMLLGGIIETPVTQRLTSIYAMFLLRAVVPAYLVYKLVTLEPATFLGPDGSALTLQRFVRGASDTTDATPASAD